MYKRNLNLNVLYSILHIQNSQHYSNNNFFYKTITKLKMVFLRFDFIIDMLNDFADVAPSTFSSLEHITILYTRLFFHSL